MTLRTTRADRARLGPCEAKAIATETGWSKSHTSYTLRAMAELGMATSRPLPNNRLLWTVVDGSEVRVDCNDQAKGPAHSDGPA